MQTEEHVNIYTKFKAKGADWPQISIITVVYNREKYLDQAIRSVISQPCTNLEYLVIDGGSTDGTIDIIKKYEDNIDYWISEPDDGIYDAINKGINKSTGDVIGILNSDDVMNEGVLQKVAGIFAEQPDLDFVYSDVDRMTKSGKVYGKAISLPIEEMQEKKYRQIPIQHGSLFVKKTLFSELGLYKTNYVINSDYDFILKLIANNKKGKKMDSPVSKYRDGGTSSGYLTFWERRKLLKEHGVSFLKREITVYTAITKLFLTHILPDFILSKKS